MMEESDQEVLRLIKELWGVLRVFGQEKQPPGGDAPPFISLKQTSGSGGFRTQPPACESLGWEVWRTHPGHGALRGTQAVWESKRQLSARTCNSSEYSQPRVLTTSLPQQGSGPAPLPAAQSFPGSIWCFSLLSTVKAENLQLICLRLLCTGSQVGCWRG